MNRTRVVNFLAGVFVALLFAVIWLLVYEVVCGLRWSPAEGATKWALIQRQFSFRTWGSVTPEFFWLGPNHLYQRLIYPLTRTEALLRAVMAFGAVAAGAVALVIAHLTTRQGKLHGDARFGSVAEAERAGLTRPSGLILGSINGRTLRSDDAAHVVVVGPTRSGKGVSFVIPNGLTWAGSMVVLDIKLENFEAFGKARFERGDKVFVFAPGSARSHRYNPLDFVRPGPEMATDCANVAGFLVATSHDSEWSMAARKFVAGLLGYILTSQNYRQQRYIRSAVRLISTGADVADVLKVIVASEQGTGVPQWVFDEFNQLIAIADRTRASVMFNVNNAFAPWSSELVCAVTETSDFDIRKLRSERISIFIGSPLADLESYRPLVRVLFQQIHDVLMRKLPGADEPHGVLLLLDEFFALGKMTSLASKIAVSAGYGFRMAIILQNISQLDEIYGQSTRETMISGAAIKLFVAINDNVTAKFVSESLGTFTARSSTKVMGQGFALATRVSIGEIGVPLRRPQELTRMASDTSILLIANSRPFEVGKLYYYKVAGWRKLISSARTSVIVPKLRAWSDAAAPKLKSLEPALGPSTTNSAPESSFAVAALHAIETHASTIGAINVGFKAVESTIPAIEIVAARRPPTGGNLRDRWGSPVAEKRNSDDAKRDTQAAKAKRKRTRLKIVAPSAKAIAAAGVQDISAEVAKAETDIETEFAELITISESAIAELPEAIASGLRQGLKSLTVQHTRARKRRE